MGRHHHPLKLRIPDHLYLQNQLTPPATPSSSLPFASSLLSVKSAVYPPSSSAIFQEAYGARAVGDKIPGFKTSAAFFTTLRANLTIDLDSPPPSYCNTPNLRPTHWSSTAASLPPLPSPLAYITDNMDDNDDKIIQQQPRSTNTSALPPLLTTLATTEDDKVEVLHLIADSVAQQRQYATSAILYNPLTLATLVGIFALIYQYLYRNGSQADLVLVATTCTGVVSALLAGSRLVTRGYIDEAEAVGTWKWLDRGREDSSELAGAGNIVGESDDLLLSRFGPTPIGGLVLRGVRRSADSGASRGTHSRNGSANSNTSKSRRQGSNGKSAPITGVIRGFTVANRYRGKGVGTELLEEAIKVCQERGWSGPEFDGQHANSRRVLPGVFGKPFERREARARGLLERVKGEMGVGGGIGSGKKRR